MKPVIKSFILLLIIAFASSNLSAQIYLNFSKRIIRKSFKYFNNKYPGHTNIVETDSTIFFTLNDPAVVRPLTELFHFDRSHRCDSYAKSFDCDSCLQKSLKAELHQTLVKWTQLTPSLYAAKFKRHRILEIIKNTHYTYVVRRTYFTKKEYQQMIKNKTY